MEKEIKTYGDLAEEFSSLKENIHFCTNDLKCEEAVAYQEALMELSNQYGDEIHNIVNLLNRLWFSGYSLQVISDHSGCKTFDIKGFNEIWEELNKIKAELDKEIE